MERVERDDGVEELARRIPVLERRGHDLDLGVRRELAPSELGEVGAQLDREDREAALGERTCGLAGAAADLEHACARLQAGQLDEVVEHLRRRDGPRVVVAFRSGVERRASDVPLRVFRHASCRITGVASRP